jgi:hypothetical protein
MSSNTSSDTNNCDLGNNVGSGMVSSNSKGSKKTRPRSQGIFWIITLPENSFEPSLPDGVQWIRGQLECGDNTGYKHWQLVCALEKKGTCRTLQSIFGRTGHYELSRSAAANLYVFKEDTRVHGTQFELGNKTFDRSW